MQIIERTSQDVTVLDLKGKLTESQDADCLESKVDVLVRDGRTNIVLNFQDCQSINSVGLGVVVRSYTKASRGAGA
ncbi:MAG: STAS domain-containing protein [Candidatus Kerfeldbacteria bacterium]|nr:STAS domain-containing protein [Candidatus Kerfeldbacteria bacterium]